MIPTKLVYFRRSPQQITNLAGETITAYPTFPANVESTSRLETAEKWSKTTYYNNKPELASKKERENQPFNYLQVVDLDFRAEGGRAWKVIDAEGHLFDLREDILQEVILHFGIGRSGVIEGSFIWAVEGSQIKLIVNQGKAHQQILKTIVELNKHKNKLIKKEDLVVGNVYVDRNGGKFAYAGKVKVQKYETTSGYKYSDKFNLKSLAWESKHLFFHYYPLYSKHTSGLSGPYLVKSVPKFSPHAATPQDLLTWQTIDYLNYFKNNFTGLTYDVDYYALLHGEVDG